MKGSCSSVSIWTQKNSINFLILEALCLTYTGSFFFIARPSAAGWAATNFALQERFLSLCHAMFLWLETASNNPSQLTHSAYWLESYGEQLMCAHFFSYRPPRVLSVIYRSLQNQQLHLCLFPSWLVAKYFGLTATFRELTGLLLKLPDVGSYVETCSI
jgi:hypothetical protein